MTEAETRTGKRQCLNWVQEEEGTWCLWVLLHARECGRPVGLPAKSARAVRLVHAGTVKLVGKLRFGGNIVIMSNRSRAEARKAKAQSSVRPLRPHPGVFCQAERDIENLKICMHRQ